MKTSDREQFASPPIVELALAVQFDRIDGLHVGQLGMLWRRFAPRFPKLEEQPALPPMREVFGGPSIFSSEIQLLTKPPAPRLWLLNEAGTELVQIQEDLFAHNWRKRAKGDEYPSYEPIREEFANELADFDRFLEEERLGHCSPNLCVATYIDHMPIREEGGSRGDLGGMLTFWDKGYSDPVLGFPEEASCGLRWILTKPGSQEPIGRLYLKAQPALRKADGKPILVMESLARGKPLGPGIRGALDFLDFAHERLVACFMGVTREEMKATWRKVAG